jgi:hypothetical protein
MDFGTGVFSVPAATTGAPVADGFLLELAP